MSKEESLNHDIKKLAARCDDLQSQINDEKKAKVEVDKMRFEKGQETLLGD